MLKNVHHINLLVKDLDAAVQRYRDAFSLEEIEYGDLSARGVKTARFRAGETWIVLVQPTDPEGEPGKHLAEKGEGLFLLSFEVDSLESASQAIEDSVHGLSRTPPRCGLDDWQVQDLEPAAFYGANLQLTEEKRT